MGNVPLGILRAGPPRDTTTRNDTWTPGRPLGHPSDRVSLEGGDPRERLAPLGGGECRREVGRLADDQRALELELDQGGYRSGARG